MKSGYDLVWTRKALTDLDEITAYLTANFSDKEISGFFRKLEKRLSVIVERPLIYPQSRRKADVRRSVLTAQTTIYYRVRKNSIQVLSLFQYRQRPGKLRL